MERRGDPSWWRANLSLCRSCGRAEETLRVKETSSKQKSPTRVDEQWEGARRREPLFIVGSENCPRRSRSRSRRGIGGDKRKDRQRPKAGDCRSWASPFRTDGRRRAGAQVATLAGELGLDPPPRPMERKSLSAPRSPHLGSRYGGRSPRAGVREPSGGEKGVESRMSRHMLPSSAFWTPSAVRAPPASEQGATLVAALREKLKEAPSRGGRKRRGRKWLLEVLAERVLESTADALAMAELDSRRRRGQAGSSEDTEKRN